MVLLRSMGDFNISHVASLIASLMFAVPFQQDVLSRMYLFSVIRKRVAFLWNLLPSVVFWALIRSLVRGVLWCGVWPWPDVLPLLRIAFWPLLSGFLTPSLDRPFPLGRLLSLKLLYTDEPQPSVLSRQVSFLQGVWSVGDRFYCILTLTKTYRAALSCGQGM